MGAGRPSQYDYKLCLEICEQVSLGKNIKDVLDSKKEYPSFPTFCKWKRENDELFELYYSIPKMKFFKHKTWNKKEYKTNGKFDKNKYYRLKRNNTPSEKIRYNISSSIYQKIKKNKKGSVLNNLPFKINDLIKHLESNFEQGMSWDNYGQWHIDHIKPHSLFNYTTMQCNEFKECWSIDNLQPLWAIDNIKKSNKYASTSK